MKLNRTPRGRTPLLLGDLAVGDLCSVEPRNGVLYGYGEIVISEGLNELTLVLEQEMCRLLFQTVEEQAEVYIDGVKVGIVGSGY